MKTKKIVEETFRNKMGYYYKPYFIDEKGDSKPVVDNRNDLRSWSQFNAII